jgi:hypothetical protein
MAGFDGCGDLMKERKERGGQEKRPYAKPSLTSYGSITELTRTAAGNCRDNVNAFNNAQLNCYDS